MTFGPKTWVVGETVSAALLNQEIRDQFNSMFGAWTPYTPVWTATGTAPSIGNGVLGGQHMKVGRMCTVVILLSFGSTTTYGTGSWRLSLPFQAGSIPSGTPGVLNWVYNTTAASNFMMGAEPLSNSSTGNENIWMPSQTVIGDWNAMTESLPVTPAAGYSLRGYGTYQTAT